MIPALPTYQSAAAVLERKNGAGLRLAGWTVARSALIAAGVMLAGVPVKKAVVGGLIASVLISTLAVALLAAQEPR